MRIRLILAAALAVALLPGTALALTGPSQAVTATATSKTIHIRLRAAIKQLAVAKHSHEAQYNRDKQFGNWITQHGECDTRAVVLIDESLMPVTTNDYCTVSKGKWYARDGGTRLSGPSRSRSRCVSTPARARR